LHENAYIDSSNCIFRGKNCELPIRREERIGYSREGKGQRGIIRERGKEKKKGDKEKLATRCKH